MLTCKNAAKSNAVTQNFSAKFLSTMQFTLNIRIKQDKRVKIAISGMEVAIETTVSPTTIGSMRMFTDTAAAPLVKMSPPKVNAAKPSTNKSSKPMRCNSGKGSWMSARVICKLRFHNVVAHGRKGIS